MTPAKAGGNTVVKAPGAVDMTVAVIVVVTGSDILAVDTGPSER